VDRDYRGHESRARGRRRGASAISRERAPSLAVTDPLTGLANHRQLVQALEPRSGARAHGATARRGAARPRRFEADHDRHGHLAGSLAIRRVAEALLGSCRATDTAARFGGDEFALVLPETGEAAAWHVARGVADRLATDAESRTCRSVWG